MNAARSLGSLLQAPSLRIGGSVHGRAFIRADHGMYAEGGYHLPVCDWG